MTAAAGAKACRCPICGSDRARWSVMKTGRVSITHGECGVQIFARGDEADELMRDKFIGAERNVCTGVTGETAVHTLPEPAGEEGFQVWGQ